MSDMWRPLGVEGDDDVANYDALHDGVPEWMSASFWAWIEDRLTENHRYRGGGAFYPHLNEDLSEQLAQTLHISMPNLRYSGTDSSVGRKRISSAIAYIRTHHNWLQVADYLLAFGRNPNASTLDALLGRSKSSWRVGERAGKPGLVRRVPEGVQIGADTAIARSGRAGMRLAKAWEQLYGIDANPSEAYRLSILAVEDAAIPRVSPKNAGATLGTVLKQLQDQGDWVLPLIRQSDSAPSVDVIQGMVRLLWHGQHDRHGGIPSAPGNVSQDEAIVAIGLATTLVHWFEAGLIRRSL